MLRQKGDPKSGQWTFISSALQQLSQSGFWRYEETALSLAPNHEVQWKLYQI